MYRRQMPSNYAKLIINNPKQRSNRIGRTRPVRNNVLVAIALLIRTHHEGHISPFCRTRYDDTARARRQGGARERKRVAVPRAFENNIDVRQIQAPDVGLMMKWNDATVDYEAVRHQRP
jgi:hypothetical protein